MHDERKNTDTALLSGREPFFVVMNAGSGNRDSDALRETIASAMAAANRRHELLAVPDGNHLIEASERALREAQEHKGIVVAVGGDGTLNAVSRVVLGSSVPFGVLPMGTFNYFARNLGIPRDTTLALRGLLDAVIRCINVGLVNDRIFLVNASLGLYPRLLEDREAFKQRFGRTQLVALWSALVTLLKGHRQLRLQIDSDGESWQLRAPTIVVDNNALQLEHMGLEQSVEPAHNRLVAITSRPVGTLALYGVLLRGLLSRMGDDENVISFGFDTMTVRLGSGRRYTKVAMDGETSWLRPPLVFRVASQRLPLLVPREPGLFERA